MKNVSYIMESYFKKVDANFSTEKNPVVIKKNTWKISKREMYKAYTFKSRRLLEYFIVEILKHKRECNAIFEFRCKKNIVEFYITSDLVDLTEVELECAKSIDKIKKDIMYYHAPKE
jgi:hypothetical protein